MKSSGVERAGQSAVCPANQLYHVYWKLVEGVIEGLNVGVVTGSECAIDVFSVWHPCEEVLQEQSRCFLILIVTDDHHGRRARVELTDTLRVFSVLRCGFPNVLKDHRRPDILRDNGTDPAPPSRDLPNLEELAKPLSLSVEGDGGRKVAR